MKEFDFTDFNIDDIIISEVGRDQIGKITKIYMESFHGMEKIS